MRIVHTAHDSGAVQGQDHSIIVVGSRNVGDQLDLVHSFQFPPVKCPTEIISELPAGHGIRIAVLRLSQNSVFERLLNILCGGSVSQRVFDAEIGLVGFDNRLERIRHGHEIVPGLLRLIRQSVHENGKIAVCQRKLCPVRRGADAARTGTGVADAADRPSGRLLHHRTVLHRIELPCLHIESVRKLAGLRNEFAAGKQQQLSGIERQYLCPHGADAGSPRTGIGQSILGSGFCLMDEGSAAHHVELPADAVESVLEHNRPRIDIQPGLAAVSIFPVRRVNGRNLHNVGIEPVLGRDIREEVKAFSPCNGLQIRRPPVEGNQNHRRLRTGQGLFRAEGSVRISCKPSLFLCKGDRISCPVVLGNIFEIRLLRSRLNGSLCQRNDQLHTGNRLVWPEFPIRITVQDSGCRQCVNSSRIPRRGLHVRKNRRSIRKASLTVQNHRHLRPRQGIVRMEASVVAAGHHRLMKHILPRLRQRRLRGHRWLRWVVRLGRNRRIGRLRAFLCRLRSFFRGPRTRLDRRQHRQKTQHQQAGQKKQNSFFHSYNPHMFF